MVMKESELREKISEIVRKWNVKPVLFIGSGISKRYKDLPDWRTLLTSIAQHIFPNDKYYMQKKIKEYQTDIGNPFQKIAKDLSEQYDELFYDQKIDVELQGGYDKLSNVNPFKFYLANIINSSNYNECYHLEKEKFQALNNYISNIITTNYDTIIEENFSNFTVKIGEEEMLNSRLYNIQELYKIHGCISNPSSIVFTSEDYNYLEAKQKYLIAKLLTTFIEYPIIFMGYGIQDTDINNILADVKKCLNAKNLEAMSNKMIFINYVEQGKENIHNRYTQDIPMTQIDLHDYTILYDALTEIKTRYEVGFLRRISESITKLVYSEQNDNSIIRVTSIDNSNNEDLAILIGSASSILKIGYKSIGIEQIYEDIFRGNSNYDAKLIIESTLPQLRSNLGNVKILPLYKFKKDYKKQFDSWLEDKRIISIESYFRSRKASYSDRKAYESRKIYKSISSIKQKMAGNINAIIKNVFLNAEYFSHEDLRAFLDEYWDITEKKTVLKKIVVFYDLKRYK